MNTRVLCVVLDAADQGLLRRWANEGHLPTLRYLLEQSAWTLTEAPLGMPASVWHTFVTATLPGKHGRHADRQVHPGTYDTYRFLPMHVKREPFWPALGRAGQRVAVIDAPYVTVTPGLNGMHVVDWTSHSADEGFSTWPPELAPEIVARFGRDEIGLCDHLHLRDAREISTFRDALTARVAQKVRLATHFLDAGGWDLFLVSFGEAHCVGHQCWQLNDPKHPEYDAGLARTVGNPMRDVYAALDRAIAALIEPLGPETTVCVLATHGMGPYYNGAHLLDDILHRLGHTPAPLQPSRSRELLRWLWRLSPARMRAHLIPAQKRIIDRIWPRLDPRATCFNSSNGEVFGAIRVNLVGREPQGKISPGADLDAFFETLSRDFCALTNVETGAPAVRRVLRTRDLYDGPYLDDLPDLLIEWTNEAPLRTLHSPKTGTIHGVQRIPRTGHHLPNGLFTVRAPSVLPGELGHAVSIADVAPTLATLLGVSIADVDGRPIPLPTVPRQASPA